MVNSPTNNQVKSKLKFSEDMYGDNEILKEVEKIATKHAKNIEIISKIREEEKMLGMPLLDRRLEKLRNMQ